MENQSSNNLPAITQITVTGMMNIALTQQQLSVQKIQDEINSLEFNEDNLEKMSDLLIRLKKAKKVVEETHKTVKKPYADAGKICDTAKNSQIEIIEQLEAQVAPKHAQICAVIEKRKQDQAAEKLRVDTITGGIENNVLQFASQIAACDTNDKLLSVERAINLEKSPSRKAKYMEFHDKAIERYDNVLLPLLKDQKQKIKEREDVLRQIQEAEDANNPQKLDELHGKKDQIENEILQNQVDVQQNALNQPSIFEIAIAEEVLPDIKTTNRISFEIVNLAVVVKKCPELLDVSIKFKDAQKVAMALKEAGTFKEKEEVVVNGIRFFVDKSYRP